ncbi:MAG: hypothetical protein P1U68_18305 [Verrucomicrobiales bacterium]|nr:hypothetical protein [Verrucomicrobiales bacterium]
MSTAKSLTDEQIAMIRQWADDGAELSDIQKRLSEEFEIKFTYLETRFLLEDQKIELKPKEVPEPVQEEDSSEDEAVEAENVEEDDPVVIGSEVAVTIDTVLRPGALISGQASFAGGDRAAWWLDQEGRLGLDPASPEFRPTEDQMRAFQIELQRTIQESGM